MIKEIAYWGTIMFLIINFITILIMIYKPGTIKAFREKDIHFFLKMNTEPIKLDEIKLYENYNIFRTIHFGNFIFNVFISICTLINILDGDLLNIISNKKYGDFFLALYFITSFILVIYKTHERTNDINRGNIFYINEKKIPSRTENLKIKINSFILNNLSKIKKNNSLFKLVNGIFKVFLLLPILLWFYKLLLFSIVAFIIIVLLIVASVGIYIKKKEKRD